MIEVTLPDGERLTIAGGRIRTANKVLQLWGNALALSQPHAGRDVSEPDAWLSAAVQKAFPDAKLRVRPEAPPPEGAKDGPAPEVAATRKHYGPGKHPGTGTAQEAHGGDGVSQPYGTPHVAYDHVNDEWKRSGGIFDQVAQRLGLDKAGAVDFYVDALQRWQKEDPTGFVKARDWYQEAHRFAATLAQKHGLTIDQAAGVIAAASPETEWESQNASAAEGMIRVFKDVDPYTFIYREDIAAKIAAAERNGNPHPEWEKLVPPGLDRIRLRLSEVPSELVPEASIWYHAPVVDELGIQKPRYWSNSAIKVARILRGEEVYETLGGPKTRAFAYNIAYPHDPDAVTVDRWAVRAIARDARISMGKGGVTYTDVSGEELPEAGSIFDYQFANGDHITVNGEDMFKMYMDGTYSGIPRVKSKTLDRPKRGTPKKPDNPYGMYAYYADFYEQIAKRLNILPNQAQAAVWTYIRDIQPEALRYWPKDELAQAKSAAARRRKRYGARKAWHVPRGWINRQLDTLLHLT